MLRDELTTQLTFSLIRLAAIDQTKRLLDLLFGLR